MPSKMESFDPGRKCWVIEEILKPGKTMQIEQHLPDERVVYYGLRCSEDDSKSELTSYSAGSSKPKIEAELKKDGKSIIISINGSKGAIRLPRKFSHI